MVGHSAVERRKRRAENPFPSQIAATDRMVYALYGLTPDEIQIVERKSS
jgi:hypothetical protein